MQSLSEIVLLKTKKGWFTKREGVNWLGKGGAVFDGALKRALAAGEVLRVARGLYCLRSDLWAFKLDPHVFAPLICGPSYLSFESALAYRGWIPEAVFSFASASMGRSREFETPFGASSLDQTGPWTGLGLRVDGSWCAKALHAKIGALDFSRVREDVRNFLKPVEQRSLGLWDRDFFAGVVGKVFKS